MSEQLSFTTIGGQEVVVPAHRPGMAKGWAAPPGTGPKGEFCKTCEHAYAVNIRSGKRFWKCELVKKTGGPGSDIRLKWAACRHWEKQKHATLD